MMIRWQSWLKALRLMEFSLRYWSVHQKRQEVTVWRSILCKKESGSKDSWHGKWKSAAGTRGGRRRDFGESTWQWLICDPIIQRISLLQSKKHMQILLEYLKLIFQCQWKHLKSAQKESVFMRTVQTAKLQKHMKHWHRRYLRNERKSWSENKINELFVKIDRNRNGQINYCDFFEIMGFNPCMN